MSSTNKAAACSVPKMREGSWFYAWSECTLLIWKVEISSLYRQTPCSYLSAAMLKTYGENDLLKESFDDIASANQICSGDKFVQ